MTAPPARPGKRYPVQKVLMVSTEVAELIEHVAQREDLRQTQVMRSFLHAGIRKAGYADILTTDTRRHPENGLGPDDEDDE